MEVFWAECFVFLPKPEGSQFFKIALQSSCDDSHNQNCDYAISSVMKNAWCCFLGRSFCRGAEVCSKFVGGTVCAELAQPHFPSFLLFTPVFFNLV